MRRYIQPKKFNKRQTVIQKSPMHMFNVTTKDSKKLRSAFANALLETENFTLAGDFDSCVQRALKREKKR